jgi:hypothetical protein
MKLIMYTINPVGIEPTVRISVDVELTRAQLLQAALELTEIAKELHPTGIRAPTVHLNGTSRDGLLTGYRDAYEAVSEAIDKLAACSPHGRDYYPQGEQAIVEAGREHRLRIKRLTEVKNDLETLAISVAER